MLILTTIEDYSFFSPVISVWNPITEIIFRVADCHSDHVLCIPTGLPSLMHEMLVTCPEFQALLHAAVSYYFTGSVFLQVGPVAHLVHLQMCVRLVPCAWA